MRDLKTMLIYECERNPLLASLATQIDLSDAEIDAAAILPWMRQALKQRVADRQAEQFAAQIEAAVSRRFADDPVGELRAWTGQTVFLPVDHGHLQVADGMLLWFSATGVWIDTIFTTRGAAAARRDSIPQGEIKRSEYYERLAAKRNGLTTPAVTLTGAGPLSGVRIYRVANSELPTP